MRGLIGGANRITGLASGLDVDALVENMTKATQMKIAKQYQSKQLIQWQMNDYRTMSSKLIEFQKKFTSYSSDTNLRSESFFGKNQITAVGENSKYVTVSGTPTNGSNASIIGVKQLAEKASAVSNGYVSGPTFTGGEMQINGTITSELANTTLTIKHGNDSYSIYLDGSKTYNTVEELKDEINAQLKETQMKSDSSKNLGEYVQVEVTADGKFSMKETKGNALEITGGSDVLLNTVGWKAGDKQESGNGIVGANVVDQSKMESLQTEKTFSDLVSSTNGAEKTLQLNYNGRDITIKMPKQSDTGAPLTPADIQKHVQSELDRVVGQGKVKVDLKDNKLQFTTLDGKGNEDQNATLKVTGGSEETLKALGLKTGQTNRLNLNTSLKKFKPDVYQDIINNGITINGVTIGKGTFNESTTMNDVLKAINESDAGVQASYIPEANKFSFVAKQEGAGTITYDANVEALFGSMKSKEGKDAIALIDYDGAGGLDPVEVKRSSNTFDVNGLSVTVNGTFNVDGTDPSQAVKFDAKVDSEKVTNAVKDMINSFNDIIKFSNDELKEKRERDYQPLTDEQKKEMSEDEIKKWEEKAQKGMLFNSPELRQFTADIRFIFSSPDKIQKLEEMGITVSNAYGDHGKINFDEAKFKSYLEKDSDAVAEMFAGEAQTVTNEKGEKVTTSGGIMHQINSVFDKYAATTGATKGIFVEKAGAIESPLSMLQNTLQKDVDNIDKQIKTLKDKLERETESYYQRFASLETYINNMNAQSSWLAQQFAG